MTSTAATSEPITGTATLTATATATATRRPTRTPTPAPAYLPMGLKDPRCVPQLRNLDVMFVLDGSNYMEQYRRDKPAWDTAREMVHWTLDAMDWTPDGQGRQDQAGLVVYRHQRSIQAHEMLNLSPNKGEVERFLDGIEFGNPRDQSRLDIGMLTAAGMVLDSRHKPGSLPVLIILSEMQTKGVPNSAEGCDPEADDYCSMLRWASDIKASGVTIAIFATGWTNRSPELKPMASDLSMAYELPTREQIAALHRRLSTVVECDPLQFWPYNRP
jgi:hypothetical protein